jgi:DNA-binding response OmpR family regulator
MAPSRRVLIANTNEDVVDMLRVTFERAGWQALTAHIIDAKRHRIDLPEIIRQFHPSVIVYDVAPPYDENWTFLQELRKQPIGDPAFIVTTTNERQLAKIAGAGAGIELVGKPFDLEAILAKATTALANGQ